MKNRFDLEQEILDCWGVVDDIDTIYHAEPLYENTDEMMNALLGLKTLYKLKFERLFSTFEDCVSQRILPSGSNYTEYTDLMSDGGMDPRGPCNSDEQ